MINTKINKEAMDKADNTERKKIIRITSNLRNIQNLKLNMLKKND